MIHLVVPIGRVGDGGEYGLRGNVCAVLKPPVSDILGAIVSVVPLSPGALENALTVQIVDDVDDVTELSRAARDDRRAHRVRLQVDVMGEFSGANAALEIQGKPTDHEPGGIPGGHRADHRQRRSNCP